MRDYFAAKALQGLLADPNVGDEPTTNIRATADRIAFMCYMMADAMLEARK